MGKYTQESAGQLTKTLTGRIANLDRQPSGVGHLVDLGSGIRPLGQRAKRYLKRMIIRESEPDKDSLGKYRSLEELRDLADSTSDPYTESVLRREIREVIVLRQLAGNINGDATRLHQVSLSPALAGVRCNRCGSELGRFGTGWKRGAFYWHLNCIDLA